MKISWWPIGHLEEFICTLYGYKEKDVNKVWWLKFRDLHTK